METLWSGDFRIQFVCCFLRDNLKFGPVAWRKVESIYGILRHEERQRILKNLNARCEGEFVVKIMSSSPEYEADDSR